MTIEQCFLRYRDHGDIEALGSVFDRVAQELAVVAAHLAPTGIDAEDLVQATFVLAMQHAQRFDSDKPLTPWLIGILVNQVRRERRHMQRSPPIGDASHAAPDPLDVAQLQEVAEQVGEALRNLPLPYRQTLTLRLLHGLQPTQIATALDCPIATCKTRLQRGMELLRHALPAGIATTLATVLIAGKGLANCRQLVLAQASSFAAVASTATTTATITAAGVVMKKTIVAIVAIILLATAVTLQSLRSNDIAQTGSTVVAKSEASTVARAADIEVVPPPVRIPASIGDVPARPDTRVLALRGRVVDSFGGGLSDVEVALSRISPGRQFADAKSLLMHLSLNGGRLPRLASERQIKTDPEGRFSFDAKLREQGSVLIAWHPSRSLAFHPLADSATVDESILELVDHGQISGRVLDAEGRPVANIRVSAYPAKSGMPVASVTTNADGDFEFVPLAPNRYQLRGRTPKHKRFRIEAELGSDDVRTDIQLELLPELSALLVDTRQIAWTGVRLENACGVDSAKLSILATTTSCRTRSEAARGGRDEERLDYDATTGRVRGFIRTKGIAFLSLWSNETRLAEAPVQGLGEQTIVLTPHAAPTQTLRVQLIFDPNPAAIITSKVRLDCPTGQDAFDLRIAAEASIKGNLAILTVPASDGATSWWLSIEADGYTMSDELLVWPTATPLLVHNVKLSASSRSIDGIVVDANGEPIENALVLALAVDGSFVGRRAKVSASTDRHGAFHIAKLPDRDLRVLVDAADGMAAVDVPRAAKLPLRLEIASGPLLVAHTPDGNGVQYVLLDIAGRTLLDDRLRGTTRFGVKCKFQVPGNPHRIDVYLPGSPLPFARGERSPASDTVQLVRIEK